MRRSPLLLLAALFLAGCGHKTAPAIYAPHEEGLTLAYENPQLPGKFRRDNRLQVRVSHVSPTADSRALKVEDSYTTLKGEISALFQMEDGAVFLVGPDGRVLGELLPKGFPDRTREWSARGRRYRVQGRAMATGLEVTLPEGFSQLGVWVESAPAEGIGPRSRTFYLPDLGEVETQEFRNGEWLCVNRLVARGFTDVRPAARTEPDRGTHAGAGRP